MSESDRSRPTGWVGPTPEPAARRAFLDACRVRAIERYDRLHAPTYDREWGAISASHATFVRQLLELSRPHGTVLDAPCGTGKYWPLALGSGRTVVGIDQSAGMLRVARDRYPSVPAAQCALQDLAFEGVFDAVMCVDAMEFVGPEDWPTVLCGLSAAARPGAPLYLTVELGNEDELRTDYRTARVTGPPVVPGESFDGAGYHYFPEETAVRDWLDQAGLGTIDVRDGNDYRHFLLRREA